MQGKKSWSVSKTIPPGVFLRDPAVRPGGPELQLGRNQHSEARLQPQCMVSHDLMFQEPL